MSASPPFPTVSIDVETIATVDLKTVGAHAYAAHPDTRVICLAFAFFGDPFPQTWREGDPFPSALSRWVAGGGGVRAWNAAFEYLLWNHDLRDRFSLPALAPAQMVCTMAEAATNGLPLSLDKAAEAVGLDPALHKDAAGRRLMLQMTRPRVRSPLRWWHEEDPAKFDRLVEYCAQDVRVERAIARKIERMSERERSLWLLDQRINNRGIAFDRALAENMRGLADAEMERLRARMKKATNACVPSVERASALLTWANARGWRGGSVSKADLDAALADPALPEDVREAFEVRREAAKTSTKKLKAMEAMAGTDDRIRGTLQYYGAYRTGRWAGRGIQIQNFPRSSVKDQEALVRVLGTPDAQPEDVPMIFGVPCLEGVASALRGCLRASPGKVFAAVDFSQIEARVLAWLAEEDHVLEAFERGDDLYKVAAGGIYGTKPESVTAEQRQIGKVATLALGYQGAVGAFQTMAAGYGVELPESRVVEIVKAWRAAHPKVVDFWRACEKAAREAHKSVGREHRAGRVAYVRRGDHVHALLPSGRSLVYRDADLDPDTRQFTFMGEDRFTRKWERLRAYGGLLVENLTQAVARDVLAEAMLAVDKVRGVEIVGSVHDEVLLEMEDAGLFPIALDKMRTKPAWAGDLPIDADGYVGERFRKG